MKKFISLVFIFVKLSLGFSQSPWTPIDVYPNTTSLGRIVFSIDDKVYMICGEGNQELWEYNPDNWGGGPPWQPWQRKADFPGPARRDVMSFAVNGKGYMGLGTEEIGQSYLNSLSDLYEYDPLLDTWTQKQSAPTWVSHGFAFVINGKGYVGGGKIYRAPPPNTYDSNFLLEYDPASDDWTIKSNLSVGVPYYALWPTSFSLDGFGYVGLGQSFTQYQSEVHKDFFKYNPVTDSWTKESDFPGSARFGAFGFNSNSKGYVCSGRTSGGSFLLDLWEFSGGAWKRLSDIPGSPNNYSSGTFAGTNAYIGPGIGGIPWYQYNPLCDLPEYTIQGADILCNTSQTYSLNENVAATWTHSSNIMLLSGQGTSSANFRAIGSGPGWIKATISIPNECGGSLVLTKDVQGPTTANFVIESYPSCGGLYDVITFVAEISGVTYDWTVNGGTLLGGQGTQSIYARMDSQYSMAVHCYVTGTGACGSPSGVSSNYISPCYGFTAFNVSPNPAKDVITLEVVDNSTTNDEYEIEILDNFGEVRKTEIRSGPKMDINTSDIPNGQYILRIVHKEGIVNKRIMIKR